MKKLITILIILLNMSFLPYLLHYVGVMGAKTAILTNAWSLLGVLVAALAVYIVKG